MRALLAVLIVALFGCVPPVVPPDGGSVTLDASGDVYVDACAVLASLHCKEGADDSCVNVMRTADAHLTSMHPACVAASHTVKDVQVCRADFCQ